MARERLLHVCVLNISATPHPEGIYVALLRRGADILVNVRGNDYAKITPPERDMRTGRYYTGRILVWTEIDLKGRWLDLTRGEELSNEIKETIRIPPSAKPNFRVFSYVLDNDRHLVYFETRNEFGQTLGASIVRRIFERILSPEVQQGEVSEVEVTVVLESGAVEHIFALPGLRVLYIKLIRPNPDISDAARQRILSHLSDMHARKQEIILSKASDAAALTPTPDIEELAVVASSDGEVRGEGRDPDGHKLEVSTSDYPQRIYVGMDSGASFLGRLLATLRR